MVQSAPWFLLDLLFIQSNTKTFKFCRYFLFIVYHILLCLLTYFIIIYAALYFILDDAVLEFRTFFGNSVTSDNNNLPHFHLVRYIFTKCDSIPGQVQHLLCGFSIWDVLSHSLIINMEPMISPVLTTSPIVPIILSRTYYDI